MPIRGGRITPINDTWHQLCGDAGALLGKTIPSFQEVQDEELSDVMSDAVNRGFLSTFDQLVIDEAQALHTSWVEALATAFQGKPIHAFCDESQVFSFERDRITLEGLENLLGTRAYHLSVVLRMPTVVSQRLQTARPPARVQPAFPRPEEPDTLRELACNDPAEALRSLHGELTKQGVLPRDIVVLSRLNAELLDPQFIATVQELALRHLTVARFRGLEAPVTFIVGCEDMSDNELTCAYSRATTLCVAHYNVETLAKSPGSEKGTRSKLVALVQSEPSVREACQAFERTRLTSHLIGRQVRGNDDIESVRLGWSHDWRGWLVMLENEDDPASTWVDFLALFYRWPVFVWYRASWLEVYRVEPVRRLEDEICLRRHSLWVCHRCSRPWPQTGLSRRESDKFCAACDDEALLDHVEDHLDEHMWATSHDAPGAPIWHELERLDDVIQLVEQGRATPHHLLRLPAPLGAVAERRHAVTRGVRPLQPGQQFLPDGRAVLYRVAIAFSLAAVARESTPIPRDIWANRKRLTYAVWSPPNPNGTRGAPPDESLWRQRVANAFSTIATDRGLLRVMSTGVFAAEG